MKPGIVIHTSAPIMPLTQIVQHHGMVITGEAAGGRADCMYGWGEAMADPIGCKRHYLVMGLETPALIATVAQALVDLDYQVVVTDEQDWSQQYDTEFPSNYDDHHHQH